MRKKTMSKRPITLLVSTLAVAAFAQTEATQHGVTEQDFLGEMPIVLSVSRLAQRLDETPGAVTILDRRFIRQSGARDVSDLLRIVPGFQTTTSFETDAQMATYHGRADDWANRIQVLVDGRSVYAGHLQGSTGLGWQTLGLDDIERIEILRGSNSATYGARAFLGVVNIVSRDVRDTIGASVRFDLGENQVRDAGFRAGWGGAGATFRVSADVRGDDGLRNAFGKNRIGRVNLASNFNLGPNNDLGVRVGYLGIDAGHGTPGDAGNNARMRFMGSQFVQADWRSVLDEHRDIAISVSHTQHTFRDSFPIETDAYDLIFGHPYRGIRVDFNGEETNDVIALQCTTRSSDTLRFVLGTEVRRESLRSRSSFDEKGGVVTEFFRLFGNLEWRLAPNLLLNAGAMAETISDGSDTFSPRVMVNWQPLPGQTFRAGVSTASRPPSGYEKYTDVKYYDINHQNPLVWKVNDGKLTAERVLVSELGYYANLPALALTADVRVFHEQISNGIANNRSDPPEVPEIHKNTEASAISGLEYQLTYQATASTRLFWSQTWTHIDVEKSVDPVRFYRTEGAAAPRAASLAVSYSPSPGWELSLGHNYSNGGILQSSKVDNYYQLQRTDVRLARAFKWSKRKAEIALTVQNVGPAGLDGDRKFEFAQRARLTLRIDE